MIFETLVSPKEVTKYEFAKVSLNCKEIDFKGFLDIEYSSLLKRIRNPSPITLDFLLFASVVYAADKVLPRTRALDNWTRDIQLKVPVSDTKKWSQCRSDLENCLSFLTGDDWKIQFLDLKYDLIRPRKTKGHRKDKIQPLKADAVSLFSGGLDSLVGAIDWLEAYPNKQLLLVSHYDKHIKGPFSDQVSLKRVIEPHYNNRIDSIQARIGQDPAGEEKTYRSRSLLYIALGIYAADALGKTVPLIVPENGTIAINMPLTPSRRGSCSTRTAHPFFFSQVKQILNIVGLENPIYNPLGQKTKGECVEQCQNLQILKQAVSDSVSCAKRGHKITWIDRTAKECGRCIPCIYRRASLNKIDYDLENYGRDICTGEVDPNSTEILANDFRSCISFLKRKPTLAEIANMIITNGSVPMEDLLMYARLVNRSMDEIRRLIEDKGSSKIKRFL